MTDRPPFYLTNCHVIVKPYGWLSYLGLAGELHELDDDVYSDVSPVQAGSWLVELGVPTSARQDEDGDWIPGVAFFAIDAELRERRRAARERRARRALLG